MSQTDVTRPGQRGTRPGREATPGLNAARRWRGRRRAEQPMVPPAEFTSYYGKPILNPPTWQSPDIPGYLFLGGLAGGSSLLAAGADLTGRPVLAKVAKGGAAAAAALSIAALVHDLGRPGRFVNMMRVFKVTSPMSVGSWLLGAYVPAAGVAALAALTGRMRGIGNAATASAALLGPGVAAYTAALISDTAVPAWHDGYPEMPFVFTGSAMMAAGGLGLLAAPVAETAPARNLALLGAAMEATAFEWMRHRIGMVAEPYSAGRGGNYIKAGKVLAAVGTTGAWVSFPGLLPGKPSARGRLGGRPLPGSQVPSRRGLLPGRASRAIAALSGAALIASSAATRFGIFHAGFASARDPKYTVVPQRQRLNERARGNGAREGASP
jgi:hypothetical protein